MTLPPAASVHQAMDSVDYRWQRLNDWLVQHQKLWRPVPFTTPEPGWIQHHPGLADWLADVSDADCERYENDLPALASALMAAFPGALTGLAEYTALVLVPELVTESGAEAATLPETDAVDMPGRKRQQAGAFAAAVGAFRAPVLDWCCGKGHLARTLVRHGAPAARGLEWNTELVEDGNRLARHYGDPLQIQAQDVLADEVSLPADHHAVALHACGDLHRRLLQRGSGQRLPRLTVSPCCYHLSDTPRYQPLSQRARSASQTLILERDTLRLAVQETVTAPARVRAQTEQIGRWRLGFDALQRTLRGEDTYLPVPSHPPRLNQGSFEDFCRWAADKKGLTLPADTDWRLWEAAGVRRAQDVRRHELLRHLFRRPL
ncbi:MAG: SAM-dependent methyltransferase, partial [Marinobacter sp. 34-60-7]